MPFPTDHARHICERAFSKVAPDDWTLTVEEDLRMLGPEDKIMCTDRLLFLRAKWVNPLTREKWVNTRCVNISRPTSYNSFQILELEATLLAEHAKLIKREELKKQHARF